MANEVCGSFVSKGFLSSVGAGGSSARYREGETIFAQGDPADALFYIQSGKVKMTTVSAHAKEAVIGIHGAGEFFGEGCLAGQAVRISTAVAMADSTIVRLEKAAIIRVIHDEQAFARVFLNHLVQRNARMEEDLIDQLFNSSEKRLARVLLLLANFGKPGGLQAELAGISQQTLAEMVGTTRSRVNYFMNKFRRLGYIDYNGHIEVRSSLFSVLLQDEPRAVQGDGERGHSERDHGDAPG
jgi:CRP-like cAMP-binding protein